MHLLAVILFALPFAGSCWAAANGAPWWAAALAGYLVTIFLSWCFAKES